MLVLVDGSWYIVRYVCFESAALIIPFQLDANKQLSLGVGGDFIVLFEGLNKVVGMSVTSGFNSKVIHYYGEGDGTPNMPPQSRGELHWEVAGLD